MSTSLNKYLSQTGICSRREADTWIDAGRVKINGRIARKGNRVEAGDTVTLDDRPLGDKPKAIYLALHKPVGITCTTDRRDPTNIVDFVSYPERIFPIGRLDKPSTGLILLTNDGDIVNRILRVQHGHEKEYVVTVDKPVTGDFLRQMSAGVPILNTVTKRCKVKQEGKRGFRIILTQGLNRQIRRMCEYLGYRVQTLHRERIMNIHLNTLPVGKWRHLNAGELAALKKAL